MLVLACRFVAGGLTSASEVGGRVLKLRVWLCAPNGSRVRVLPVVQPEVDRQLNTPAILKFNLSQRTAGRLETPFVLEVEQAIGEGRYAPLDRDSLFVVDEDQSDDADQSQTVQYTAITYVQWLMQRNHIVDRGSVEEGERIFAGNAGAILADDLIANRGSGWAPWMTLGFTASVDSAGAAWQASDAVTDLRVRVPEMTARFVQRLADEGLMDYATAGLRFDVFRSGTTRDRTNVVLGGSTRFSRVPVKTSTEGLYTTLLVLPSGLEPQTMHVPGADLRFGKLDGVLTQSGVSDAATSTRLAQAHLADAQKPARQESYEYTPEEGDPIPGRDFTVGDVVTGRARGGSAERRVIGVTIRQPENGGATVRVTVGEAVLSGEVRRAKRLGSVTVGDIIGGNGGGFPATPPLPTATPKAPLGVTVGQNVGRWGDDGTAHADVGISWSPVSEAEDGSEVTPAGYEIWSRLPGGVLALDTATSGAQGVVSSWEPGRLRMVAVRAQSARGKWGPFSTEIAVTPEVPASIVPKPVVGLAVASNTAAFVSDGRSLATVAFSWSAVTQSTDNTPVEVAEYEFSVGAETQRVTGLTASVQVPSLKGVTARVRALSAQGVWGDYSAPLTVTGASPAVNLPAPSLTIDGGMGGVLVGWNGLLGGSAVPAGFARTVLEVATAAAGPWKVEAVPWTSAGSQSVAAPVGETRWVRARAFDTLGRPGTYSAVVSATALGVPISEIPGLDGELSDIRFTADGKNRIYVQAGSPGAAVESRRNLLRRTRNFSNSQAWSANGGGSGITYDDGWLLVTPTAPNADTFADIDPSRFGGLKPNTTYTIMARLRVYVGSTGTGTQTNSLWMYVAGSLRGYVQPPGVNVPGEYEVRVTFATPASLVGLTSLRLYSGRTAPSAWTDIAFVEGAYDGPFFDGSTLPSPGKGYAWSGTPNASESIEYESDFAPGDQWWVVDPDGVSLTGVRMWNGVEWVSHVIVAEHVIAAGSITGALIKAGTLRVDHVEPNFGANLDISASGTVTTIINTQVAAGSQISAAQAAADQAAQVAQNAAQAAATANAGVGTVQGQVSDLEGQQSATAGEVATIQTWFRVDAEGGHMGRSDSPFQSHIKPDRFEITQDGVPRAWLEANRLVAPEFVGLTVVLSNHKLEQFGTGTVVRRLG